MRKKRIGIITIFDLVGNYGNKLQNYAVVQILTKYNYQVDTIVIEKQKPYFLKKCACLVNRMLNYHLSGAQLSWIKSLDTRKFEQKYLNPTDTFLKGKDISNEYDYFVIGSDQVWNPIWYNEVKKEAFLLTFARIEQKVCIAPSFGISEIPEEWKEWFSKNLKTFPNISVREVEGAKIVKELTGKDSTVLIDPTLMLSTSEWRIISEKPKKVDVSRPYLLTYFLGEKSDKAKSDIGCYCETFGLVEYNLQELNGHYPYASNPGQFVYLIEHATLVMTDSFHACVFSFLFSKPFLVYERKGMMSRIETLLDRFDLQRKFVDSGIQNDLFECDYRNGYVQLELERYKFKEFLEFSLKNEELEK